MKFFNAYIIYIVDFKESWKKDQIGNLNLSNLWRQAEYPDGATDRKTEATQPQILVNSTTARPKTVTKAGKIFFN